jgi:hypothetical protein
MSMIKPVLHPMAALKTGMSSFPSRTPSPPNTVLRLRAFRTDTIEMSQPSSFESYRLEKSVLEAWLRYTFNDPNIVAEVSGECSTAPRRLSLALLKQRRRTDHMRIV